MASAPRPAQQASKVARVAVAPKNGGALLQKRRSAWCAARPSVVMRHALYFRFRDTGIEILDAISRLGDATVLRQVILEGVGPTT